jgi:DNA-binding response OmpR family regulator
VTLAGEPIDVTSKEYGLLCKLAAEPERVFTKDELLRDVWGFKSRCQTRTLDSHASARVRGSRGTAV